MSNNDQQIVCDDFSQYLNTTSDSKLRYWTLNGRRSLNLIYKINKNDSNSSLESVESLQWWVLPHATFTFAFTLELPILPAIKYFFIPFSFAVRPFVIACTDHRCGKMGNFKRDALSKLNSIESESNGKRTLDVSSPWNVIVWEIFMTRHFNK